MKKILAFLFALPLLFACTPDHLRISMDSATVLTRDADVISDDSAVLYGELDPGMTDVSLLTVGFIYSTSETLTPASLVQAERVDSEPGYTYEATVSGLLPETDYYFCMYVLQNGREIRGETLTFTPAVPLDLALPAVDMGTVVNGKNIKWAPYNLGANSPEESGDYYAWGEVQTKDVYSWDTYKFGHSIDGPFIRYSKDDERFVLSTGTWGDDVASVKLGGKWRMPTEEDFKALVNSCQWQWIEDYNQTGVSGRLATAQNGHTLFFPASEAKSADSSTFANSGYFWASTRDAIGPGYAAFLYIPDNIPYFDQVRIFYGPRYYGFPIRPVTE